MTRRPKSNPRFYDDEDGGAFAKITTPDGQVVDPATREVTAERLRAERKAEAKAKRR